MKKEKTVEIEEVDFCNFTLQKKIISINGKSLPLRIGDKIKFSDADKIIKTVVAVTILEDSRVQYALEWYNPENGNFETESVTLSELKLLSNSCIKNIKNKIGF